MSNILSLAMAQLNTIAINVEEIIYSLYYVKQVLRDGCRDRQR